MTGLQKEEIQGGYANPWLKPVWMGILGLRDATQKGEGERPECLAEKDGLAGCKLWSKMEGPCAGAGGEVYAQPICLG